MYASRSWCSIERSCCVLRFKSAGSDASPRITPLSLLHAHQMQSTALPSNLPDISASSLPQSIASFVAAVPSQLHAPAAHVDAPAADTATTAAPTAAPAPKDAAIPSQKDFAIALGVSQARISQLVKIGMPLHSITAAKDWRTKRQRSSDDAADSADAAAADEDAVAASASRASAAVDYGQISQRGATGIHIGGGSVGLALGASAQAALLEHYGAAGAGFNMNSVMNRAVGGGGQMFGIGVGGMRMNAGVAGAGSSFTC